MQSLRTQRASLKAIDGSLASIEIVATRHEDSVRDSAQDALRALGILIQAADAGIPYRMAAESAHSESDAGRSDERSGCRLSATLPGAAGPDGVTITRVRAFDPVMKSRLPGLDAAFVSAGADASAGTGSFGDSAAIDVARRYAHRYGWPRVHVLTDTADPRTLTDDRDVESAPSGLPGTAIELMSAADAVASLAAGNAQMHVIVGDPRVIAIASRVASTLSGAEALVTEIEFAGDVLRARPATLTGAALDAAAGGLPLSALMLAAAELLPWLNRADAAARILNAWCRTIEFGSHTAEFPVASPCSKLLGTDEFTAAVIERLHEAPRSLRPMLPTGRSGRQRARRAPRLRLVSA